MASAQITKIIDLYREFLYDIQLEINEDLLSDSFVNKTLKSIIDDTAADLMSRIDFKFYSQVVAYAASTIALSNGVTLSGPFVINPDFLRLQMVEHPVVIRSGDIIVNGIDATDFSATKVQQLSQPKLVITAQNLTAFLNFTNLYYRIDGDTIDLSTHIAPTTSAAYVTGLTEVCFVIYYVVKNWLHSNAISYPLATDRMNSLFDPMLTIDNYDTIFTSIPKDLLIGGAKWRYLKSKGQEFESYYNEHEQRIQDYYKFGYAGAIQ